MDSFTIKLNIVDIFEKHYHLAHKSTYLFPILAFTKAYFQNQLFTLVPCFSTPKNVWWANFGRFKPILKFTEQQALVGSNSYLPSFMSSPSTVNCSRFFVFLLRLTYFRKGIMASKSTQKDLLQDFPLAEKLDQV